MATHTVGSGKDYSTIAAAVADSGVSSGDILTIDGGSYVGWSTSKNLTYQAASGAEATGEPNKSGGVKVAEASANAAVITLQGTGTSVFDGLEVQQTGTGSSKEAFRIDANGLTLTIKNCVVYGPNSTGVSDQDAIYNNGKDNWTVNVENTIGFGWGRGFIDDYNGDNVTVNINSSTFYDINLSDQNRGGLYGTNSSSTGSTVDVFNVLYGHASGSRNPGFDDAGGNRTITVDRSIFNIDPQDITTETDTLIDHNFTDDDTKSSDGDWVIVENITTYPFDLRLVDNAYNEAHDAHSDSSGAGLTMPSTDIAGTSRPQNTDYDIGAHEIVAGGSVALAPAGALQAQSVDSPTLAQAHSLSPASASHAQAADDASLTQANQMTPADSLQSQSADSASLAQAHMLSPRDALESHAADTITLSQSGSLAPEGVVQAHESDQPTLTQAHVVAVASASHLHVADATTLTVAGDLNPANAVHGHVVDSPALTQAHSLTPDAADHAHSADQATIDLSVELAPAGSAHMQSSDAPTLTQAHMLAVNDAIHAHFGDQSALITHVTLVADDALHAHLADNAALIFGTLETPAGRVFLVPADRRVFLVH